MRNPRRSASWHLRIPSPWCPSPRRPLCRPSRPAPPAARWVRGLPQPPCFGHPPPGCKLRRAAAASAQAAGSGLPGRPARCLRSDCRRFNHPSCPRARPAPTALPSCLQAAAATPEPGEETIDSFRREPTGTDAAGCVYYFFEMGDTIGGLGPIVGTGAPGRAGKVKGKKKRGERAGIRVDRDGNGGISFISSMDGLPAPHSPEQEAQRRKK